MLTGARKSNGQKKKKIIPVVIMVFPRRYS